MVLRPFPRQWQGLQQLTSGFELQLAIAFDVKKRK